ncbi:MAG: polymer-forming cytoskeletal protein, partial [Myxococcales bacterium]|nr:polymer-forming cytoskeletal protein [Myxococcales bacterium]
ETALPAIRTVAPSTSIDATTEISGKLRCGETLRIDGRMKGEIRCDKTVIVGQGASVEATIQADAVVIGGEVKGDIIAKRKVTLESSGRVIGDLSTPGIVIEEGAKLEGRIVIGAEEGAAAHKQPAARTSAPARDAAPSSDKVPAPSVTTPPR